MPTYPDDVTLVRIRHTPVTTGGRILAGNLVSAVVSERVWGEEGSILPAEHSTTIQADGSWEIELPAVDSPGLRPQGAAYRITEHVPGGRALWAAPLVHHAPGPVDLADVLTPAPSPGGGITIQTGPATDASMAEIADNPDSQFHASLSGTIGTAVPPLVASAIADDDTIREGALAAATTAVQAAVDDQGDIADPVIAAAVTLPGSATGQVVTRKTKDVQGGQFLAPIRVPTLTTLNSWPNISSPRGRLIWQEDRGQVLYLYGNDASLYVSQDGGQTWTSRAYLNWAPFSRNAFLRSSTTATLVGTGGSSVTSIRRSTDDGATWTQVHTTRSVPILGSQSMCEDPTTGDLYYGEYGSAAETSNLYRSQDDGQSWQVLHEFPTAAGDPDRVRHIHAVQWDPFAQRVVICVGDSTPATGLYRVTAAGDGVEPVLLNRDLPGEYFDGPRSIGIMPFQDHIAWASDSTNQPYLFRMHRSQIGAASPVVERVYRTNSTSWWSVRAADDGSRWVFSSSQEAPTTHAIDRQVHLYAVEDEGATVYELGALAQLSDDLPAGSLMPVGDPGRQGDMFFLAARNTGHTLAAWGFRLAQSSGARIDYPVPEAPVAAWRTAQSGQVTVPPDEAVPFHADIAAAFARNLRIFDANMLATDGSAGRLRVEIVDHTSGEVIYSFASTSARQSGRQEWSTFVDSFYLPASRIVRFQVRNSHAASPATGIASITYGWG